MMRLTVVTGSLPPDVCGCGDYVKELVQALPREGVTAEVFFRRDWSYRRLFTYIVEIRKLDAEVINLQYPTEGYGKSLLPQLLCCLLWGRKCVVTLHEFSRKSFLGKVAIYSFFLFADWIIFTTEIERQTACAVAPWMASKSSVVSIGSNIPMQEAQPSDTDVVYFGLIRPAKGIEEVIATLSQLTIRKELRLRVIGQVVPAYESYCMDMFDKFAELGIEVVLGKSAEEVSQMLSRARVSFLPFPDGMSRRRGSALAAMGNGSLLVTTAAHSEIDLFRKICVMPSKGESLYEVLRSVLDNYDSYESIRRAGQEYAQSISWEGVASAYVKVIDQLQKSAT